MRLQADTYHDRRVRIYHGDALSVIPRLRAMFAAVITDPPYEDAMHKAKSGAPIKRTDGHKSHKPTGFAAIGTLRDAIMPLIVPRCSGWFIAFCTPEGIAAWRDAIERNKARYKRACFFYKPDAAPQFNGQGPAFAVEPFVTAWCGRGVSRWNGGGRRNLFEHATNSAERHGKFATEKPIDLMIEIIELFTQPDALILDPLMGSGTTALAAMATGRRFVGIEKDRETYTLARGRIEAFRMGKEEGRRHIAKLICPTPDPGPLFAQAAP